MAKIVIDCTISKAGAVSLIKALSEALLHESGRPDVRVCVWDEDDYRIGFKVNRDIAVFGTYGEVQA